MTRRLGPLLLAAFVVAGSFPATIAPAGAQPVASGSLALASAPRVTPRGTPASVNLAVSATAGVELRWQVLQPICSRNELAFGILDDDDALSGGPVAVPGDGSALRPIDVVLPTERSCDSGIFPVRFRLGHPDDEEMVLDELVVYVAESDPEDTLLRPLSVALHLDLGLPVALRPDGSTTLDADAVEELVTVVETLVDLPDVPVTLTLSPESIAGLVQAGEVGVVEQIATIVASPNTQILESPLVRLDEATWWSEGLRSVLDQQYAAGNATLSSLVGATPTNRTILLDPSATPETLDEHTARGTKAVITGTDNLSSLDRERFDLTLTERFVVRTAEGTAVPAAQLDNHVGQLFGDGPYEAHELITDLLTLTFDQPHVPRGVVVEPPDDWRPTRDFLRELLTGLRDNPLLRPVTFDQFFSPGQVGIADADGQADRTGPLEPLVRRLVPTDGQSTNGYLGAYNLFAAGLDSYSAIIGEEGADVIAPLRQRLLVAGGQDLASDEAQAYFTAVGDVVTNSIANIEPPRPETITLTARRGDIPITIVNDLGYTADVVLVLQSDKLEFPEGTEIPWTLRPGVNDDITIPVRARTSGDSLLQVTVRSPDLRLQLGSTGRVTVRSTALSGLGVVMSIAALAMLSIWWGRQILRSRREKSAAGSLAATAPTRESS